ncbi:MAG: hypothetical protein PWQ37_1652 [Candidatus Petromonas sp.]|jgi:glycosyltransferase involved in cell wall biosynthesis|nr:hypothetical protein [Candidatus Petromonas sp.]
MSVTRIATLIPAYNEEKRIANTIKSVKESKYIQNILVIDDGSTDMTWQRARELGVEVLRLNQNKGKGYALSCGIQKVINDNEIIVFLDGDLGSTAKEADKLITPILNNECDVTIGKFKITKKKGGFGLVKLLARKGVKSFTNCEIESSLSGQRAFKSEVLKKIEKIPSNYGVEVSMTIDILRAGYFIREIDVDMNHRETGRDIKGFIHRGKQFYQILLTLAEKSLRC